MQQEQNNRIDDLLVKYMLGEAGEAERSEVEQWLAQGDANRKYFEGMQLIWSQSRELAAQSNVDENQAWARFVARTEQEVQPRTIPFYRQAWVRVAALFVVGCGLGWAIYTKSFRESMMITRAGDTTVTDTLPDGSVVVLNKHSLLTYPSKFAGDKRSVKLEGEAFFSITPNKSKPFIIDANNTSVRVVGTTFNVKTSPEQTEVIVETGIVQVAKKEHKVEVLPHQKAIVTAGSDTPQKEDNTDELYAYYRTKEFICRATPLRRLAAALSDAYDVNITIANEQVASMTLTAAFRNESLDHILKVINETLGVRAVQQGRDILLTKDIK